MVSDVLSQAEDAALAFVRDGIDAAMNRFNRGSAA
jgi:hypothetical protein